MVRKTTVRQHTRRVNGQRVPVMRHERRLQPVNMGRVGAVCMPQRESLASLKAIVKGTPIKVEKANAYTDNVKITAPNGDVYYHQLGSNVASVNATTQLKAMVNKLKKQEEMERHFKNRDAIHAAINEWRKNNPNKWGFPVKYGLAIADQDIEWWSASIPDADKRRRFMKESRALINSKRPFKNGMDVPRGVDIEHLYYKIQHGYTDEQYADHLASYD